MKRQGCKILFMAIALMGCMGAESSTVAGPSTDGVGGKADDATAVSSGIVRRHESLLADVAGDYSGALVGGGDLHVLVQPSERNDSHTPRYEALIDSPTLDQQPVALTYDAAHNAFVGFYTYECDDPGCVWFDFVSVRVHRNRSRDVVLDYAMSAVRFDDGEGDGDTRFDEQGQAGQGIVAASPIVFDAALPGAIESFVSAELPDLCDFESLVVTSVSTEELDGELYYSMTMRSGDLDGYLRVVDGSFGLEVDEYVCPGE